MAKRYRCTNCGTSFVADRPTCAKCDIDASTDQRAAGVIHSLCTIHFDPPHPKIRFRGLGHPACNPSRGIHGLRGTGEPSVVNCEACRATEAWKQAYAAAGDAEFLGSEDEVVQLPVGPLSVGPQKGS